MNDVRRWMAAMVESGTWEVNNPGVAPPAPPAADAAPMPPPAKKGKQRRGKAGEEGDEDAAAAALQSLSVSLRSQGGGAAGEEHTSARRKAGGGKGKGKLARSGSSVQRASGALMAAVAAKKASGD